MMVFYQFAPLPNGIYTVTFDKDGVIDETVVETLKPGVINYVIDQEIESAGISGMVTVDEEAMEDVTVNLLADGSQVNTTTTDADGEYEFLNIDSGQYDIEFAAFDVSVTSELADDPAEVTVAAKNYF